MENSYSGTCIFNELKTQGSPIIEEKLFTIPKISYTNIFHESPNQMITVHIKENRYKFYM